MSSDDSIRTRSQTFLQDSISAASPDAQAAETLSKDLEEAIFRAHQSETGNDYRNVIRQKGLALKQKHNEEIIGRLLNGSMSPDDFANTDLESLASPERQKQNEEIGRENLQNSIGAQVDPPNIEISEEDQDVEAEMKSSGTTAHPELDLQHAL